MLTSISLFLPLYFSLQIFMVVGWMLIAPLGILIARYGRTMFKWFPVHRGMQFTAFLLIFIAFFLAIAAVGMEGGPHFAYTHNKVGLALFILLIVQVLLGVASHTYRGKTGKRYIGFAHIPLGLILFGESCFNRNDQSVILLFTSILIPIRFIRLANPPRFRYLGLGPTHVCQLHHLWLGWSDVLAIRRRICLFAKGTTSEQGYTRAQRKCF